MADSSADSPGCVAPGSLRLGRYQLVVKLGEGALGTRWASYITEGDERGRLVSVRLVRCDARGSRVSILVGAAARQAQSLRHPKLLAVLDVLRTDQEFAVVSEYMDGEDLGSLLRAAAVTGGPIPPNVALAIARDMLETLVSVAEERARRVPATQDGLASSLHGGLSPDAVFVATFGDALLTELGVAGAACRHAWFAEHEAALPYRAPEQLRGSRTADQRADVYTVGVLLWEMLANRSLFGGDDRLRHSTPPAGQAGSLLRQVLEDPIPSLETVPRRGAPVPPDVAALVAQATARQPNNRYQSTKEMLSALKALPLTRLASAESIAATLDRLARRQLEARRAQIERASGARIVESVPPSDRDTGIPDPPSRRVSVLIPRSDTDRPRFTDTEEPTATGNLKWTADRSNLQRDAAPARDLSPLPLEIFPLGADVTDDAPADLAEPRPPSDAPTGWTELSTPAVAANVGPSTPPARPRGVAARVALGAAVLFVAVGGAAMWVLSRPPRLAATMPSSGASSEKSELPLAASAGESEHAGELSSAAQGAEQAPSSVTTGRSVQSDQSEARTKTAGKVRHDGPASQKDPASQKERPRQEDRNRAVAPAAAENQKGFRPSGI